MTLAYLQQFTPDFSPAQRRALEDLVQRSRDGLTINLDEVNALAESITAGVKPMFRSPVFEQGVLSGCKLNTALETIRIDLTTMYNQLRTLEDTMVQRQDVQNSEVAKLQQAIYSIEEQLLANKYQRLNPEFTEIKVLDFSNSVNEATSIARAYLDPKTGQVSAGNRAEVKYLSRTGALRPSYEVTVLSEGLNPDRKHTFLKEEAANKDPNTVWAEVVLADSTLDSTYEGINYNGMVVLLDIHLPQMERCNVLSMAAFGKFEPKLLKAQYLDGDMWLDVPGVVEEELYAGSRAFRFDPVNSRSFRLVLLQDEYLFNQFVIDKGQIKRMNWLNISLEGNLESSINEEGVLPARLRDERRARAVYALRERLKEKDGEYSLDKYKYAIESILQYDNPELTKLTKYEYVIGLRDLELNYNRYQDGSEYESPSLKARGSVFESKIQVQDSHFLVNNENVTSVQYRLDIGGGRELPILPEGTVRVQAERMKFDANRTARTIFNVSATPDVAVNRNGVALLNSEFTVNSIAGDKAAVTVHNTSWNPVDKYSVSYNPEPGQDHIKLLDFYDSIKIGKDEFTKTERNNRITLHSHPFVLKEIMMDKRRWSRPDPRDARWAYRGPVSRANSTDDPYIIRIDGVNYGTHPNVTLTNDLLVGGTSVDLSVSTGGNTTNAFPGQGTVKIGDELIYYTEYLATGTGTFRLTGLIRGYNNTDEAQHASGSGLKWQSKEFYSPVYVRVNGARCINRTDYIQGENPAFSDRESAPEYIQVGSTLYFDRPVSGRIEVEYARLVDYLKIKSRMYCDHPSNEYTSVIDSVIIKLATATI